MVKRKFLVVVENALGDRTEVPVSVRANRAPTQYAAMAVRRAMLILPDVKPFKAISFEEVS